MTQAESETVTAGYALRRDADLSSLTTFRVAARAGLLAEVHDPGSLPALLRDPAIVAAKRSFVLGGGSNVLFTRDFDGVVLKIVSRRVELVGEDEKGIRVRVAAGENWDAFVRWTLGRGLAGLENLVLIPGTVGAAPIQNIGAYGVELAEFVVDVEVWDREQGKLRRLGAAACGFAYRESCFKRERDRYIVLTMELQLPRKRALRLDYAGVREELAAMHIAAPTPVDVARAVERLRRRKLPNPAEIGNAGSFFKNPIVSAERAAELKAKHPGLPVYPLGSGRAKLAAAWLIEACGFKGRREGDAGVSDKHALVLINYGKASGTEILALAGHIRAGVMERFGLTLEPEAVIL